MIDKLWNDWQHMHAANFWSYTGGLTALVKNFIADETYPNGAPPFLNVGPVLTSVCAANNNSCSSLR